MPEGESSPELCWLPERRPTLIARAAAAAAAAAAAVKPEPPVALTAPEFTLGEYLQLAEAYATLSRAFDLLAAAQGAKRSGTTAEQMVLRAARGYWDSVERPVRAGNRNMAKQKFFQAMISLHAEQPWDKGDFKP